MHILVLNSGASVRPDMDGAELRIPDPEAFFEARGINTGDLLVYDATLRHLDVTKVTSLGFAPAGDPRHWPKTQPDVTIIRGSNYLMEGLEFGHMVPLLRHLTGPVIALGVGAQAAAYRRLALSEGSIAFWRLVAEKSRSLGVRGAYSAEVLEGIGIRNLRIIGCPSFYRSRQERRPIRAALPLSARVGLTLNRMLAGDYTANAAATRLAQTQLLGAVARRPGSRLYAQGEREEMLLALGRPERRAAQLEQVLGAYGLMDDPSARDLLGTRMAAHVGIDAWEADIAAHVDVMVGLRLHGNVMALQQGIPAIPFVYDTRTREVADLFQLPSVEMQLSRRVDLDALIGEANFEPFERAYAENFAAYRDFLEENGLPHKLPGTKGLAATSGSSAGALTGAIETA
jgi:hypothetical protein